MIHGAVEVVPAGRDLGQTGATARRRGVLVGLSVTAVVALLLLHYTAALHQLGLHDALRRLFYLPVIVTAIAAGSRGGILVAGLAVVGFVPHLRQLQLAGDRVLDSVFELVLLLLVGALVGAFADSSRRARVLAAERGRLAALGETGLALMAQTEGPLEAIAGQAESLALLAGQSRNGSVAFAASTIGAEVTRVRRLFADLRDLVTCADRRRARADLAPLVSGIALDIMRDPRVGPRLSLARVAKGCSIETDRRTLAFSLRSLLYGLLETIPATAWLEVSVLESSPGEGLLEIGAFSECEALPDLDRSLTRVFGAAVREYRFKQVLCVRVLATLGADVTFHRLSLGSALVRVHFRPRRSQPGSGRDPDARAASPAAADTA